MAVDQNLQASLLNAQGEVVQTITVGPATQTIRFDLSSQPMGIYLMRLQSDSGQALTQKLFIQ